MQCFSILLDSNPFQYDFPILVYQIRIFSLHKIATILIAELKKNIYDIPKGQINLMLDYSF